MIRSATLLRLACLALGVSVAAHGQTGPTASTVIVLEPGDVVKVAVWREKDLSCECKVDEVGRLILPMLGARTVTGIPWTDLRDTLLAHYQRELRNPSVTLTPLRRVWVLGEVNKPGPQLADPTLSLAGLIALAGGATSGGDLHRVRVVRDGKTIVESASIESLLLQPAVHSNDQIFVDRRAWLERNGAFVASALISTAGILIALIRR